LTLPNSVVEAMAGFHFCSMPDTPSSRRACPRGLAALMRIALSILMLLALLGSAVWLTWHPSTHRQALTIAPTGQPRFETSRGMQTVLLTLAVANATGSRLSGHLRLSVESQPNVLGFADADLLTPFKVGPRSTTLCTVRYNPHSPGLVLDAEYKKDRRLIEANVRRLLQGLGVPGGWTNDLWHSVRVARIVQQ